jgi:hypothetical protein
MPLHLCRSLLASLATPAADDGFQTQLDDIKHLPKTAKLKIEVRHQWYMSGWLLAELDVLT